MAVAGEYQDTETGSTTERAGFQQLMAAIRAGLAGAVIVFQTDRLHRDLAHAMLTRKELQRLDVALHTVKRGKAGATPEEQFADNIDDLLAELERARIVERTNRGKHAKMRAGLVLGAGAAPYGYQYIGQKADRRLVIDEATAPIVRQIFAWYIAGDTVNAIADKLSAMGVPSPGAVAGRADRVRPATSWERNHVYPLLNQTAYSGTYTLYRRKRVGKTRSIAHKPSEQFHVPVPAILDAVTWAAAQARLAAGQSLSPGHQIHEYLIGRHVGCACGYKAHGRSSSKNGRNPEMRLWYVCNGRVKRITAGECSIRLPWFRAEATDAAVWAHLAAILRDPATLEAHIVRARAAAAQPTPDTLGREALITRRVRLERANARLLDLYEAEELDRQEWRQRKAANDTQIAAIVAELAALAAPIVDTPPPLPESLADAVRALAADVSPRLDALPFAGRRRIVEALAVQVTLTHQDGQKQAIVASIFGTETIAIP